uniref:Olfactory receptor n=1 Tax=Nannospalax galili TaxID=1026970 RepID=A0A0N7FY80_NANGA|nr:olfactory receptor 11 [Nannospalax galili]ALG94797.1 olfactory receptor 11 [Nannospalax galili]ALG94798.1 olfactory receptor 11 [Nannospalax galili]ALG94802.1 olfactory receptor 11 [Nannospalax galili]ALG94804.1 olfactory receptor 11 [Nannospalax galili]
MFVWNNSDASETIFILKGFPGLESVQSWLSVPFCLAYLVALIGNITILSVIWEESSLHQPMYYFLSILALTDLGMSMSTLPTMLTVLWLDAREIRATACYAQLFFIHTFTFLESSVLLAMAFDRFVAICRPLHYSTMLTDSVIGKIGLACLLRSMGVVLPTPLLLRRYRYCRVNALSHAFCLHQDVLRLSCSSARINSIYGLCVVIATLGVDSVFILISYSLILNAVLSIASPEERLKALNTCVSHVCVVLIFFVPVIGVSMVHRFGKHLSPVVHVLMADIYLLLPPVLNPVVYSVRTKQIRLGILRKFRLSRRF